MRLAGLCWLVLALPFLYAQQITDEAEDIPEFSVGFDPARVATSRVPYADGSASLEGYLAYDNTTTQQRPAVVILPDWDGIGPYEEWRAHLLATLGYTAFAADIFSTAVQQGPSLSQQERQSLTRTFSSNPESYVSRIHAALDAVRGIETVDASRIALIGYCFGGAGLVQLHRSYPNNTEGVLGVASFHGSLPSKFANDDPEPNNPIRAVFYNGYNDNGSGPESVGDFEAALNATNATWSFVQYGQTVHAFTEPTMEIVDTNVPQARTGYNPDADLASWWALRGFLRDIFGEGDTSNPYTDSVSAGSSITAGGAQS